MVQRPQESTGGGFASHSSEPSTLSTTPVIDLYLDHLRVERRLAGHTLESYARDLRALAAFSAAAERKPEALDRQALEAFVRQRMASGLSPRSVARSVAAIRGYYRFLVLDRRLDESPADDLRGAVRLAGAAQVSLHRGSRRAHRRTGCRRRRAGCATAP